MIPTRVRAGLADAPHEVDVVVVGLGITGAGCALDAASRGLSVLAVDAHDLAFGTSRWSSKLVHGGLRYLANGQVGVAHESAVERDVLLRVTAPHLTHPLAMLLPFDDRTSRRQSAFLTAGFVAGDLLRIAARTPSSLLPHPRRVTRAEARRLAPRLRSDVRGGIVSSDGQLEDDVRLVVAVARTAAGLGAHVRTRARAQGVDGTGATLRDQLTGAEHRVRARAVVNATGVWAGSLIGDVRLRPSRGTHLVLGPTALPGLRVALTLPVPDARNRFVNVLPQPDGLVYVGLTDEAVDDLPDVPEPSAQEIGFLRDTVSAAFSVPLRPDDVVGAYAGLRPLLEGGEGGTADLSRRHAVLTSTDGVVTVVGGKLTTYRQMAQDAIDVAVRRGHLDAAPCRTARLPLVGAAPRDRLARLAATTSPRLVRRYGAEADQVLHRARQVTGMGESDLLAPAGPDVPVTLAELVFGVTDEGAHDLEDLLDRRCRVGLVASHRSVALPLAERALALAAPAVG